MKASLKARIARLEKKFLEDLQKLQGGCIEVFFYPKGCEDEAAFENECRAKTPKGKEPFFIKFVGPESGPEEGTGPIDINKDLEKEYE